MAKIYRFELAFDGEPQGVGFLQGIDEIGLPLSTESALLEKFAPLPCPHISESCEFWFTEAGLRQYATAMISVMQAISEFNWQLTYAEREEDAQDGKCCLYRDTWQAAWAVEYFGRMSDFNEVTSIEVNSDGSCIIYTKKEENV